MTDRRLLASNGRVAHVSLRGLVEADRFVPGEAMQSDWGHLPILTAPDGVRTRELLAGEAFRVLEMPDEPGAGTAFGFAERDGYVGYIATGNLGPARPATHVVAVRETYRKKTPDLKAYERVFRMPFGSRVFATGTEGDWTRIALRPPPRSKRKAEYEFHVPTAHLRPVDPPFEDPASVAEMLLHVPYLWGGNTAFGIDCSGLVQTALLACGLPCPGDSDQQAAAFAPIDPNDLRRGDLAFWKGHVGMMLDARTLIHANAHHMAVATEPLAEAIARIGAREFGAVTGYRRPGR